MWTDNETSLDLLGFRVHADLIRSVVMNPNLLPVPHAHEETGWLVQLARTSSR